MLTLLPKGVQKSRSNSEDRKHSTWISRTVGWPPWCWRGWEGRADWWILLLRHNNRSRWRRFGSGPRSCGHHGNRLLLSLQEEALKGQYSVRWFFRSLHPILRIERKDLKFFSCCANIYWARARINSSSAYGEYAEWYFPVGVAKNFNLILFSWDSYIISRLPWLKNRPYGVLTSCWKILAHSPNTLNAAKVQPK